MDNLLERQDRPESSSAGSQAQDNSVVYLLIANRFGPLIIIFFFSSMLITLYKYTSRLIGFYYARLYAIKAMNGEDTIDNFSKLVSAFSPDTVDFGRVPRTPLDLAGDIAVKVAQKLDPSKITK